MKKIISYLIIAFMLISLIGCGKIKETGSTANNNIYKESTVYPLTIIDQAGREVIIEKEPEKLVSCYYITTSLFIALDLDQKMVAVEDKPEKRQLYNLAAKDLIGLPTVGSAKEFDLEGCMATNPDLVVLPLKLKDAADKLDELGVATILVNPESEELLIEMIDIISSATNSKDKANALKDYITNNIDNLKNKLNSIDKKSVYLGGNSDFLRTAGKKMYQNSMIELAGGTNVAYDIDDTYWADVDYEQILVWNPEYIILAANAEYTVDDVLNDKALANCRAIEDGNVYKIPSDIESWDSPVPGSILGSVWLANILHSDIMSSEEKNNIIEEFYEKFYGFKYSEK